MNYKFAIGIPVMNQPEATQKSLDLLRKVTHDDVPIIYVDNGSNPPLRDWLVGLKEGDEVIKNEKNVGLTKALNQIWRVAKDKEVDYIINTHNDVWIYEANWIEKLDRIISEAQNIGVAGFFGAIGMARNDIYKSPYEFTQLARQTPISGISCRVNHGQLRISTPREYELVAVLDGFSLICKIEMLDKVGGFDEVNYPVHHMYDNDICMASIKAGYRNIVIDMDVDHHGGITDVGEDWATPFGKSKHDIHREAHPTFYEKWRSMLPYRVI